ncbi:heme exporter protein A [Aphanothece sacrum FPU1]|uniref:Heme exporter protein A n=1 Tax=Aphanothece sacrum FPU1 TaxID=1920663 RepID=A0A401IFZ9_APHSA|nr:heme exporter protein A [Aphanothece sacrum FPU1]GBF85366.1 heme exporter protein A [Aphanothece sacrum FPU3]
MKLASKFSTILRPIVNLLEIGTTYIIIQEMSEPITRDLTYFVMILNNLSSVLGVRNSEFSLDFFRDSYQNYDV